MRECLEERETRLNLTLVQSPSQARMQPGGKPLQPQQTAGAPFLLPSITFPCPIWFLPN